MPTLTAQLKVALACAHGKISREEADFLLRTIDFLDHRHGGIPHG